MPRHRPHAVESLLAIAVLSFACTSEPRDRTAVTTPRATAHQVLASSGIQVTDLGDPATGGPFNPDPVLCPLPATQPGPSSCGLGTGLRAVAVNQPGDIAVAGYPRSGSPLSFSWERGVFTPLPALADGRSWIITAINNKGDAAGYFPGGLFGFGDRPRAVRLSGGVAELLPTGASNVLGTRAWGINDRGDIVGSRLFPGPRSGADDDVLPRATLWRRNGEVIDLGALEPERGSEAYAINDGGQAVGVSGSNDLTGEPSAGFRAVRPVVFENGRAIDLGGSPTCTGEAYAVNERGQVAGKLCGRATVWDNGRAVALETPIGAGGSAAFGINNSGDAVGRILFPLNPQDPYRNYTFRTPALEEPFVIDARIMSLSGSPTSSAVPALWQAEGLTVLPTLTGTARQAGAAYGINNRGQIVGVNLVDEKIRAVLWTLSASGK